MTSNSPKIPETFQLLTPLTAQFSDTKGIFSDQQLIENALHFERALATALEKSGVISRPISDVIINSAVSENFSHEDLLFGTQQSGNFIVPLSNQLKSLVASLDPLAAKFAHFSTTSQDVLDTALVLTCKQANRHILLALDLAEEELHTLALEHKNTVAVARTLTQQSSPTTYGLRFANWLTALTNIKAMLLQWDANAPLQWAGASGTLAASVAELGQDQTLRIRAALAETLQLVERQNSWHVVGRPFASLIAIYAELAALSNTIAQNVSLLNRPEIAELTEKLDEGSGSSSSMPHKANPVQAVLLMSQTDHFPSFVADIFASSYTVDERPDGAWHAEWRVLQEATRAAVAISETSASLLRSIQVNPLAVQRNLDLTQGLILSEKIVAKLSEFLTNSEIKHLVNSALSEAGSFQALVTIAAEGHLSASEFQELFDPALFTGLAEQTVNTLKKQPEREEL